MKIDFIKIKKIYIYINIYIYVFYKSFGFPPKNGKFSLFEKTLFLFFFKRGKRIFFKGFVLKNF